MIEAYIGCFWHILGDISWRFWHMLEACIGGFGTWFDAYLGYFGYMIWRIFLDTLA
jgi:hypothetical protein